MPLLDLFYIASMPVLKVLIITALGSFLAMDSLHVLEENTRKELNQVVFFVFNPALVGSSLAKTITFQSISMLWFMPFNILFTFIIGSALGWILVKITGASQHLKGLVLGCCAAGNLGNLPLIIIPAVCKEKGSPFGAPDVCQAYGIAYASLSMAIGAIYLWSYVYNIVRIYSSGKVDGNDSTDESTSLISNMEQLIPASKECPSSDGLKHNLLLPHSKSNEIVQVSNKMKQCFRMMSRKLNLKALFAPSTTGAVVGFVIGVVPQIRKAMIGGSAPLRVVEDSASLLGEAAIPTVTLIMGGNLVKGLKGSGVGMGIIGGILAVRYVLLPIMGIVVVKGAVHLGVVQSDPLYQFILMLQYALPPAMNIGTMTQLFGTGESECSVIMLWTYCLASLSLTLWSTLFMWLLSSSP